MKFLFTPTAEEHFRGLPPPARKRIAAKLRFYAAQSDPLEFAERLSASHSYRLRIGDYRVIFEIEHGSLWILAIRRRDEAYR